MYWILFNKQGCSLSIPLFACCQCSQELPTFCFHIISPRLPPVPHIIRDGTFFLVWEIQPLQHLPFILQTREVGTYYRLVPAPRSWDPVFLALYTFLPSTTQCRPHTHFKLFQDFFFKWKKYLNPDNISQTPAFRLVRKKRNSVKRYIQNLTEAFSYSIL